MVEQDPVVQRADGVHVGHRALAERLQLQLDFAFAGRLVQHEQAVEFGGQVGRAAVQRVRAGADALDRDRVQDPGVVELADRPHPLGQPVQRGVGVHGQPVGQPVGTGRAGLVPGPRPGAGPDAGVGQRLEHRVEVVAARFLEQRGAEPDHLGRGVPGIDVHVVFGQGRERRVDELAQRGQGLATLGHGPLGAAQQVPVPVGHARDDDGLRLVDQRGGPVPRQDRPRACRPRR